MQGIHTPLKIPELNLYPDTTTGIELSKDMQQVLSLLTGFWRNQRVLLKASPSGVLFTTTPPIEDIIHITGSGANDTYQGTNIKTTSCMIMAHPDNAERIWVRTKAVATVNNSFPLDAGDVITFSVTNLNMVHILIVRDTEKAIIAYSM